MSAQQVGDEAKKFLTELVAAFGLVGTVELREDGDDLELAVNGSDLGLMVGPRGNTLLAVQDLTRVASQRRLGDHETRLRVDVGGYRERRRAALSRFATQIAEQVVSSGEARALEPMPSADRKVIHDVLTDHPGVGDALGGRRPDAAGCHRPGEWLTTPFCSKFSIRCVSAAPSARDRCRTPWLTQSCLWRAFPLDPQRFSIWAPAVVCRAWSLRSASRPRGSCSPTGANDGRISSGWRARDLGFGQRVTVRTGDVRNLAAMRNSPVSTS